ncbi:MAG: histidine kinase dimerization/phospho-acceptor domain-containing protein, partial [Chloroflexota bacterium]
MRELELAQATGRILTAATSPGEAIPALLRALLGAGDWSLCRFMLFDAAVGVLRPDRRWILADGRAEPLIDLLADQPAAAAAGFAGMACESLETVWVDDVNTDLASLPAGELALAGFRTAAFVPALAGERIVGVLELYARARIPRTPIPVRMLDALGEQLGLFLKRVAGQAVAERVQADADLLEHASDALVEMDADGVITRWNRRAADLFGWSAAEAVGRSAVDLLLPADRRESLRSWTRDPRMDNRAAEDPRLVELPLVHRTGRGMLVEASLSVRDTPAGRVVGAIARDVTDDRSARAGLALLARFPDENPFPVMRVAADGLLVYVNEPARRLLGSESGQRIPDALEHTFDDVRRTGQPRELEITGDDRTLLLNLVPAATGGEVNVFGTDVTSRVRAERALRESEAAVTGLYRVAADPSLQLPDQLRRLVGLIVSRFGQGSAIISRIVPGGLEVVECKAFDPAIRPGYVFTSENAYSWEALRRDELIAIWDAQAQPEWREHPATTTFGLRAYVGSPVHVAGRLWGAVSYSSPFPRGRPFRPADLDYVRLVGEWIGTAIERTEAARALAHANDGLEAAAERAAALAGAAEAANRAKSLFLATMSHEIRTPLHGLLGMVQVLDGMPLDDGQRRTTGTIRRSGDQVMAIIDDILDLSNLDTGSLDLEQRPLSPERLVGAVVDEQRHAAEGKGLVLGLEVHEGLPTAVVGDPVRLRQVVAGLVANAVRFTSSGFVHVDLAATPLDATGDGTVLVEISVTDSGPGIE